MTNIFSSILGVLELLGLVEELGVLELLGLVEELGVLELLGLVEELGVLELLGIVEELGVLDSIGVLGVIDSAVESSFEELFSIPDKLQLVSIKIDNNNIFFIKLISLHFVI